MTLDPEATSGPHGHVPIWSPDGKQLFYASDEVGGTSQQWMSKLSRILLSHLVQVEIDCQERPIAFCYRRAEPCGSGAVSVGR
jgi:hypothetical protein